MVSVEPVELNRQVRKRRLARPRPRWMPPPLLCFLLGAFLFAVAWKAGDTQRAVPDGWLTTTGVVLESPRATGRAPARDLVRWTTVDGVTRETRLHSNAAKGDEVRLAYDPAASDRLKPLDAMRWGQLNLRIGGAAAWIVGAFSAWRYVPRSNMPFRRVRAERTNRGRPEI